MGVVETEEALKAKVSEVCRFYCLQIWNEALDQVGVEASSAFRRAKNVYYPPAIRTSGSKVDPVSKEVDEGKESLTKAPPTANISLEVVEQFEDVEKVADTTKEMAHDAPYLQPPPKTPQGERGFP